MAVSYTGIRDDDGAPTILKQIDQGKPTPLDPRTDLRAYAEELEWNEFDTGQRQVSLAILADVMGDYYAEKHFEEFVHHVISEIPWEGFRVPAESIERWVLECEQREKEGLPF
jgi:hypothetical protein